VNRARDLPPPLTRRNLRPSNLRPVLPRRVDWRACRDFTAMSTTWSDEETRELVRLWPTTSISPADPEEKQSQRKRTFPPLKRPTSPAARNSLRAAKRPPAACPNLQTI